MYRKIYLFVFLTYFIASEAKKVKPVPSYPYILNLELKFEEDKLDDFMVDSFFATVEPEDNTILHCDVTLSDIIKAIPMKKLTVSDLIAAVDKLEIEITDDDVTEFVSKLTYEDLKSMGFTAGKVYKNIAKTYFKDRPTDLLESLNILGIAPEFSVAYTFGTDEDVFNVFLNANISRYNLVEIGNIINTTTTVKDLTNVFGLKKFNQLYLANFINSQVTPFLLEKGLTEDKLLSFLQSFSLSSNNYKSSKIVKTCYNSLTKYKSFAVAVSENEILTNDDSLISKYLNLEKYTTLSAEAVEDGSPAHSVSADNINANKSDNLIHIKIDGKLSSFIQETTTYEGLANQLCKYITTDDDTLIIQDVVPYMENDRLFITKTYSTLFKKGSPLICGENLYGLAVEDKVNTIVFNYFENAEHEEVAPLPQKPDITDTIKEFLENVAGDIDLCKYIGCGIVDKEQKESTDDKVSQSDDELVESTSPQEDAVTPIEENVENDVLLQETDNTESSVSNIENNNNAETNTGSGESNNENSSDLGNAQLENGVTQSENANREDDLEEDKPEQLEDQNSTTVAEQNENSNPSEETGTQEEVNEGNDNVFEEEVTQNSNTQVNGQMNADNESVQINDNVETNVNTVATMKTDENARR